MPVAAVSPACQEQQAQRRHPAWTGTPSDPAECPSFTNSRCRPHSVNSARHRQRQLPLQARNPPGRGTRLPHPGARRPLPQSLAGLLANMGEHFMQNGLPLQAIIGHLTHALEDPNDLQEDIGCRCAVMLHSTDDLLRLLVRRL